MHAGRHSAPLVALAFALGATLVGCGGTPAGVTASSGVAPAATPTLVIVPPPPPGRAPTAAPAPTPTTFERPAGAAAPVAVPARPDDVDNDLAAAVQTVEQYWAGVWAAQGVGFQPVAQVFGYRPGNGGSCGAEPLQVDNAAYCPAGDFIAYDEDFVARQYASLGDAFVYYLIGHEYAHAIQARLQLRHRFAIDHELQADCLAGAYIGDDIRSGALVLEDGDVDELVSGLASVADPEGSAWFAPTAHGTAGQRTDAFARGYQNSFTSCS